MSVPARIAVGCFTVAALGVVGSLGLVVVVGRLAPRPSARPAPPPATAAPQGPPAARVSPSAPQGRPREDWSWRDLGFERATAKCEPGRDSVAWTITVRNSNPVVTYNNVRYRTSYINEGDFKSNVTREGTFQARIAPSWRGVVTFTDPGRLPRGISKCDLFLSGGS
jgi:hypothetical protein